MNSLENQYLELPILLYLLALVGGTRVLKFPLPTAACVLLSLVASLLPMLLQYRFRFFSGQGLLGISLLAGTALDTLDRWMDQAWQVRVTRCRWLIPTGLTACLLLVNPVMFIQGQGTRLAFGETSFSNLGFKGRNSRSNATSFYYPTLIDPVVRVICVQSREEELIGCPLPYTCGLLAALSGRAMSTGMFAEVEGQQQTPLDRLRNAHLIIWLKGRPDPGMPSLSALKETWKLTVVGETEIAYVLRNPQANRGRQIAPPVLPLWFAEVIFWGVIGCLVNDLHRHRRPV